MVQAHVAGMGRHCNGHCGIYARAAPRAALRAACLDYGNTGSFAGADAIGQRIRTVLQGHGGALVVDSALGAGTTFRVWLPIMASRTA